MKLDLTKKKRIGTIDFEDAVPVYDYGSKFFAISDKDELLEKVLWITAKTPFLVQDIVTEERYEYLKDVSYTNNSGYTVSAVLDRLDCYVKGHCIDIYEDTIDDEKYINCSSVNYIDLNEDEKSFEIALNAVRKIFNSEELEDLSVLDEDENTYFSFVIFNSIVALFICNDFEGESIQFYSLDENFNEIDKELAYCALLAEERIAFDPCSLISLEELEDIKRFQFIKYVNDLKLKDMNETAMAKVLGMNNKTLNKSPKKEMYFNLYKQKLIHILLDQS